MTTTVAQHKARGRGASKVAEIPTAGWKDILWRTYSEVVNDHVMLIAAGVTFYTLLALVPALTALVSIYGLCGSGDPRPAHGTAGRSDPQRRNSTSFASSFGVWRSRGRRSLG